MPRIVLSARGISKRYGALTALEDVDLDLREGEVVGLVGGNGAGKSTLVSILSGVTTPTSGEISVDGTPVRLLGAAHARSLGIATVFQDLALVEARDVASNVFLGVEPRRFRIALDRRRMYSQTERVLRDLQVRVPDVRTNVRALSGGQRQAVAVARTVIGGGRLIVMDEPTSMLGVREAERVLDLVTELKSNGHAVLIVSHNMESVFMVADRIVVLRHGRKVAERDAADASVEEIVGLVVGSPEKRG